ncbi:hypothetical protein ABPG74_016019 [Tetrahymena malaccensis]
MNISTNQQLSNIGSQTNLLDFLAQENSQSQKQIDNNVFLKNEPSCKEKGKKKKYFVARKVQPNIGKIIEDQEHEQTPSSQGQQETFQNNNNEIDQQQRRYSQANQNQNIKYDYQQEFQKKRNFSLENNLQEGSASPTFLPFLNNMPSVNQSLNNSQYIPGYTPQQNSNSNQVNGKRNISPNQIIKGGAIEKPSAFQSYFNREQNDQLLNNVIKSSNLNESVIPHVNVSGIDDSMDISSSHIDKNIFLKHNQPLYQPQIGDNGPKFDKNGKIIPRSIVGKPEWFIKNQGSKLTKEDLSIFTPKRQRQLTTQSISVKSRSLNKSNLKNALKIQQEVKITKYQLEKQLEAIRERIKHNIEVENKIVQQLKTTDKLRYTQQTRNLEKFNQIEKEWMNFIEFSSSKMHRDYTQSQLLQQDGFRQKKEMTDVFETAKGAFDLFGSRVWYMNLRNSQEDQQLNPDEGDYKDIIKSKSQVNMNPLVVLEDMPLAFNRALPQGMVKKQLEIVRKPLATSLNQSLKMSKSISQYSLNQSKITNKPFQSFDSLQYYNQRLSNLRDDMKFHKKILIDQNLDLDNLIIIGQSQLQREQDMLYNSKEELFEYKKQEVEPYVEEIIEMQYDKHGIQQEGTLKDFSLPQINRNSIDYSSISKN